MVEECAVLSQIIHNGTGTKLSYAHSASMSSTAFCLHVSCWNVSQMSSRVIGACVMLKVVVYCAGMSSNPMHTACSNYTLPMIVSSFRTFEQAVALETGSVTRSFCSSIPQSGVSLYKTFQYYSASDNLESSRLRSRDIPICRHSCADAADCFKQG